MKHTRADSVAVALSTPTVPTTQVPWRAYVPLTKPTISLLVVVTIVPTLLVAAGGVPDLGVALAALVGTYLSSASASVFNHLLDRDLDQVMARTRGRPMPSGQVAPQAALTFGAVLGALSLAILYVFATPVAAAVAFLANVFYVLVYTLCLKRYTDQNIVIGGAAGAVGPLIGWAAVDGTIAWPAWALFAVVFLWTPPHFWALALKYKKDYAAAKVPMMPVTRGDETTRRQMFWYTLTLFPPIVALTWFGVAGWIYLSLSLAATLYFAWKTWILMRRRDNTLAMPVFHYSCLYLFLVFGALTLDRVVALWA
jgi:protoheme IX farnesyltransferase